MQKLLEKTLKDAIKENQCIMGSKQVLNSISKSKLVPNIDKHFLASLEKLDPTKMLKHFCKACNSEFDGPTKIQIEEQNNEEVSDELILVERGQYTCQRCDSIIAEYRVFKKK